MTSEASDDAKPGAIVDAENEGRIGAYKSTTLPFIQEAQAFDDSRSTISGIW
jgi:hypothetical protein